MIFKMDGTLNTYDVVVDFEAADFASNFLHQVFDLCQGGQVSSHAQVRLLLQHDSKELGDRRTGSSARQPLLECEAGWTNDLCKNKMILQYFIFKVWITKKNYRNNSLTTMYVGCIVG